MKTDNQIVNLMNIGKDILLFIIFSIIVWSNQSNIIATGNDVSKDKFLSLLFSLGIIIILLVIFLLIRVFLHKNIFRIFSHKDN